MYILYYDICMMLCFSEIKHRDMVFVGIVHKHSHVLELVTVLSVRQIHSGSSSGAGILETLHLSVLANGSAWPVAEYPNMTWKTINQNHDSRHTVLEARKHATQSCQSFPCMHKVEMRNRKNPPVNLWRAILPEFPCHVVARFSHTTNSDPPGLRIFYTDITYDCYLITRCNLRLM